jgi:hypothetical protein
MTVGILIGYTKARLAELPLFAVLDDSQFDDWMRGTPDQAAADEALRAGAIEAWEVRAEVGNVRNNRSELSCGIALGASRRSLEQVFFRCNYS